MTDITVRLDALVAVLGGVRIAEGAVPESQVVSAVEVALRAAGYRVAKEVLLARGSRVDLFTSGVAIEVKKGRPMATAVLPQLERYARSRDVQAVLLVAEGAVSVPAELEGKPVRAVALGGNWGLAV